MRSKEGRKEEKSLSLDQSLNWSKQGILLKELAPRTPTRGKKKSKTRGDGEN